MSGSLREIPNAQRRPQPMALEALERQHPNNRNAVRDVLIQKRQGPRGPQHRPTKTPVTVRYNPEVVAYLKGTGAGWQARMNEVLCEWVAQARER